MYLIIYVIQYLYRSPINNTNTNTKTTVYEILEQALNETNLLKD